LIGTGVDASTLGWLDVMITGTRSFCTSYGAFWIKGPVASGPLNPSRITLPSAGARAVSAVATVPPAAGLLSTTTGWPNLSLSFSPIARASTSSELPAGAGTRMRNVVMQRDTALQ
jgi:hypothetical protein